MMSKEIAELTVTPSANLGPSWELGVGGMGDRRPKCSRSRTLPCVELRLELALSRSAALLLLDEEFIKCGNNESLLLENSQNSQLAPNQEVRPFGVRVVKIM